MCVLSSVPCRLGNFACILIILSLLSTRDTSTCMRQAESQSNLDADEPSTKFKFWPGEVRIFRKCTKSIGITWVPAFSFVLPTIAPGQKVEIA